MNSPAQDQINRIPDLRSLASGKEWAIFMIYVGMFDCFAARMEEVISSITA